MTDSPSAAPRTTPARSMTGFARVRKSAAGAEIVVSVKSVNHRALDIHFHCSAELDPLENDMRALIRRRLGRGHIEVRASLTRSRASAEFAVNTALLDAYVRAYRSAAAEYGLPPDPDLNFAFRFPGMLGELEDREIEPELRAGVLEALREALDSLDAFREREASEIIEGMLRHNAAVRSVARELAQIRSRAIPLLQARLTDRLRDLLRGVSIDAQRLTQEVALLVDRSDISEEIARLEIHSAQLEELLAGGGEIGKKLDFLLQEMNRESNTILSKTTGVGEIGLRITELALAAKADIEKIREQSLNLE
jgi:uncharacterized protein (TIGR00255 family)